MADDHASDFALAAAKGRMSANAALAAARLEGVGLRRADFLTLVRQFRTTLETNATGIDRPGYRKPRPSEILVAHSVTATGFMQYIDVWVRGHETGDIYVRPYGLRTDTLMTHDEAIGIALDRYSEFAGIYGESILAGTYMGTYEFRPGTR